MLRRMQPVAICTDVLGADRVAAIVDDLPAPQVKAALKEGGIKVKLPGGYVSQARRRKVFRARVLAALEAENQDLAAELLRQWLLRRRRAMLVELLDALAVKHTSGETDESFLIDRPAAEVRAAAAALLGRHDPREAAAYLYFIAHQQRARVFDGWEPLIAAASGDGDAGASATP